MSWLAVTKERKSGKCLHSIELWMFSHLDMMWNQPVSCSNKAEPRASHNVDGKPSKSTDGNESRHDWSEHPKHAVGEGDGNGVAGEHRRRAKDG